MDFISPEFNQSPRKLFGDVSTGDENFEMSWLSHRASGENVRETWFMDTATHPAVPEERGLDGGAVRGGTLVEMEEDTEEVEVTLDRTQGQSLGFTVCRGNSGIDGELIIF